MRVVRDPENPASTATLGLNVVVKPRVAAVVWYVDGAPYQSVSYPYSVRWPLMRGEHSFYARVAYQPAVSNTVTVYVE
jgi:hypothetical protein